MPVPILAPLAIGAGMGVINSLTNKPSKQKTQVEPAAITPLQRQQLFDPIGALAGFSFTPGAKLKEGNFAPRDVTQSFAPQPINYETANSPYRDMLFNSMSNPFRPTSAEDQLLSDIMGTTSAAFARRGLGASPIAASTVGASIAPTLIALRQQQLQNIMQALGMDIGEQATERQRTTAAGLTQREQDINASLGQRSTQLQALLNFLQMVGFKRPLGTSATGATPGIFESSAPAMQGIASIQSAFNPSQSQTKSVLGQG